MERVYYVALALVAAIVVSALGVAVYFSLPPPQAPESVHEHANFLVFVNGQQLNFSQEKYMEEETACKIHDKGANLTDKEKAHLHGLIGWVAHKHSSDATWGLLFRNMGMTFDSTCFVSDSASYCNNATHELRMFVNGLENRLYDKMPIRDMDRVLVTFGPRGENVAEQLASIPDDACIYSDKCPERGRPSQESCSAV
jgi:hypothetical protein